MTIGETFNLFREVPPLSAIAWMTLHRFISVDLDEALIGPESVIRRRSNEVTR